MYQIEVEGTNNSYSCIQKFGYNDCDNTGMEDNCEINFPFKNDCPVPNAHERGDYRITIFAENGVGRSSVNEWSSSICKYAL